MILAFFDTASRELVVIFFLDVDDGNVSSYAHDYGSDCLTFRVLMVFLDADGLDLAAKLFLVFVGGIFTICWRSSSHLESLL